MDIMLQSEGARPAEEQARDGFENGQGWIYPYHNTLLLYLGPIFFKRQMSVDAKIQ